MSRILLLATAGFILLGAAETRAQSPAQRNAMQSPYTVAARNCMKELATAGRSAGIETDWDGPDIMLLDPDREDELGDLLGDTFACLTKAFGREKELIDRLPGQNVKGSQSWVWYGKVDSIYVWCASDGTSTPEDPGKLGGHGSKRGYFAIAFQCGLSEKILDWYAPMGALPGMPDMKLVRQMIF